MFHRKTLPAELEPRHAAFEAQAGRVEAARRALLSCLPVGRVDPAPIPVGLDLLRDELQAVLAEMDAWKVPPVEPQWRACQEAVAESLDGLAHAHQVATTSSELEELLEAVGDVVEPLDAWADAEDAWRGLRVRVRRRAGGR